MAKKSYYSVRTGKHPTGGNLNLIGAKYLFLALYHQLEADDYFQEYFGFECIDVGINSGKAGGDIKAFFFRKLKKGSLWPIEDNLEEYSEDDLFDVIELLYDCVSEGVDGQYHSYGDCGWHYETFDKEAGQKTFQESINEILQDYDSGYQLADSGETVAIPPAGLSYLEAAPPPPGDPADIQERVEVAIDKFRRRGSSLEDRRDAVRSLSDVLEYLRPRAKEVLASKDEQDLFNLANNFGIRHHNQKQKIQYDPTIWLSWIFYYYLATIHALTRLIEKANRTREAAGASKKDHRRGKEDRAK